VYATLVGVKPNEAGDANAVSLGLTLEPYTPPFDPAPLGLILLLITAAGLILRRVRPWRWRIVTSPPTQPSA
jgi:hypothetical protein